MYQTTTVTAKAPGRINIIGEHTDYHDGFVLPAAVDKGVLIRLTRNGSPSSCQLTALDLDETFRFNLQQFAPQPSGWMNYLMGVVHELQQLGATISGFDGEVTGNVPPGSGMSSSAALECSMAIALNELFDLGFTKQQLIKASQMAEHHFVGTKCGIMDQFASVMGKKDQVLLLDCRSLEYQYFPLALGPYQLLLLNTNVSHSLADSAYNTRREESEAGVAILQQRYKKVTHLRDVSIDQLKKIQSQLSNTIFRRCHHVITENQRVLAATQALQSGNLQTLGQLMYQSHQSLQHDYEVSCPELDFLVEQTKPLDHVLGARMMGGGFGGCTINIVAKNKVRSFIEAIATAYRKQFELDLTPLEVTIGDGAKILP